MKLIRIGEAGNRKAGVQIEDEFFDTFAFGEDYNEKFFENDGLV